MCFGILSKFLTSENLGYLICEMGAMKHTGLLLRISVIEITRMQGLAEEVGATSVPL